MKPFIQIPCELFENEAYKSLSCGAKLTAGVLYDRARMAGDGMITGMSQTRLGEILCCTRKTAAGYIKELTQAGLVSCVKNNGGKTQAMIYSLLPGRFYRLPKEVLADENLSHTEKLMYAVLLSRAVLSYRNGRIISKEGKDSYFIFTIKDMEELMLISHGTAVKAFAAIETAGLLERARIYGKASIQTMNIEEAYSKAAGAENLSQVNHESDYKGETAEDPGWVNFEPRDYDNFEFREEEPESIFIEDIPFEDEEPEGVIFELREESQKGSNESDWVNFEHPGYDEADTAFIEDVSSNPEGARGVIFELREGNHERLNESDGVNFEPPEGSHEGLNETDGVKIMHPLGDDNVGHASDEFPGINDTDQSDNRKEAGCVKFIPTPGQKMNPRYKYIYKNNRENKERIIISNSIYKYKSRGKTDNRKQLSFNFRNVTESMMANAIMVFTTA